jgi:hypothetical protein
LQERISRVGNVHDRKKNQFDPIANPVRLFRHSQADLEKVSVSGLEKKMKLAQMDRERQNKLMAEDWISAQ